MAQSRRGAAANNQRLRIIAGEWRGRRLSFHEAPGLRPTADRVRETLFNWLSLDIHNSRCLDLFAGTGALGLEALSRGAAHVTFVESNGLVAEKLRENLVLLEATPRAQLTTLDAQVFLHEPPALPYDVLFLDPPFRQDWLTKILPLLAEGWLAADAWIYLEMETGAAPVVVPEHWQLHRQKVAGQVSYYLYQNCQD